MTLTQRQNGVLGVLANADGPMTPNEIGSALGFKQGDAKTGYTDRSAREMGPAVFVTSTLTSLRRRGLVDFGPRPGGLSGTAYEITAAGRQHVSFHLKLALDPKTKLQDYEYELLKECHEKGNCHVHGSLLEVARTILDRGLVRIVEQGLGPGGPLRTAWLITITEDGMNRFRWETTARQIRWSS